MRVVLDTNVLVSSLLTSDTAPDKVYRAWFEGRFDLLTCEQQISELRKTFQKPSIAARVRPQFRGRLINDLYEMAVL